MSNCGTESLPNSGEKYFDFEFFSNKRNTCLIGNTSYFYTDSIAFYITLKNKQDRNSFAIES